MTEEERDYTIPPIPSKTVQQQWLDQLSGSFDAWLVQTIEEQLPVAQYGKLTEVSLDIAREHLRTAVAHNLMGIITTAVTKKRVEDN